MLRVTGSAAVLLALALTASGNSQDTPKVYDLSTTAQKGTTAWFEESATRAQAQASGGTVTARVTRTFRITIKQVTQNGSRIIELHVARVKGAIELPGIPEIAFDSATGTKGKPNSTLGHLSERLMAGVGKPFVARVDANGRIASSMTGVAHEMKGSNPLASVTDKELAQLAETAFGRLPAKPMAVGGSWEFVHNDANAVQHLETISLKAIDDDTFTTSIVGTLEKAQAPEAPAGSEPSSADKHAAEAYESMKVTNGTLTGTQRVSRRDGLVLVTTITGSFDMEVTVGGRPQKSKTHLETSLRRTTDPTQTAFTAARQAKTLSDCKILADAVRTFYVTNARLPKSLDELTTEDDKGRSLILELPDDGWDNPYKLVVGETPRDFEVVSSGPDGEFGTYDDISNKKR